MKTFLKILYVLPIVFVAVLIGFFYRNHVAKRPLPAAARISGQPFATQTIDGLTINLFTPGGQLRSAGNDLVIEFRRAAGELVDAGEVKLEFSLKGAPLKKMARVERTAVAGQYRATIQPEVGGDWTAQISFKGPNGFSQTNLSPTVK